MFKALNNRRYQSYMCNQTHYNSGHHKRILKLLYTYHLFITYPNREYNKIDQEGFQTPASPCIRHFLTSNFFHNFINRVASQDPT